MTSKHADAPFNQKINKQKVHSGVPTQGYNYKSKHKKIIITYQWGSTSYNAK